MVGGSHKYNMITVMYAGATQYTVTNLRKFTKYEFFLVPFFKTVQGQPSNSKTVQTLEDGNSLITFLQISVHRVILLINIAFALFY